MKGNETKHRSETSQISLKFLKLPSAGSVGNTPFSLQETLFKPHWTAFWVPSPFPGTMGTAACSTPLAGRGCRDAQTLSISHTQQYVSMWLVVMGRPKMFCPLLPSSLIHILKRKKIHWFLKKPSKSQRRNTIILSLWQPHSSSSHDFSLNALLPCLALLHPWGSWPWTGLREVALSHHLLGQRRKIQPWFPRLLHGERNFI